MKMKNAYTLLFIALLTVSSWSSAQEILTPEDYFGFPIGSDGHLARWDKIVEYFKHLDELSDRIKVFDLGQSTKGNPFILAVISSPENLANMDRYKEINRKLADPRGLSEAEIDDLITMGKYTLAMTLSLHATEVGGTQMSSQLAWELITDESPSTAAIRENCIFLLFPCFNPDGQLMVVDWDERTRGTEYEGARLPYLYHKYTGHDNNRDGFMITQAEAKMVSKVLYKEWFPQAYIDQHHMGSYGARLYIPPYYDPVHPNVDPLIWREHMLYGAHMAMRLEQAGKSGIESGAPYTAWWMPSFHMITNYHNITGMLTESASANLSKPIYVHPHQLRSDIRGLPEHKAQVNFPNPWPGGWWRLGDIVDQMKISAHAALELGATNRRTMLQSAVQKAQRSIERGQSEAPYAYLVPWNQHDMLTALKLLDTLMRAGVEVHRAEQEILLDNAIYPIGTYVIRLDQPLRTYIKSLMEKMFYPDNTWTRQRDGSPIRPYDLSTYSLPLFMGVKVVESPVKITAALTKVTELDYPGGSLGGFGTNGFLLSHNSNDSFIALNRIMKSGGEAWWLEEGVTADGRTFPPGTMLVKANMGLLYTLAPDLHLEFVSAPQDLMSKAWKLKPLRLGMYHRYQGGNSDEGWTRWIMEQFEFPFELLKSDEVKQGDLNSKYDVILLPDDRLESMLGPDYEKLAPGDIPTPPEFRSGLGDEGVEALKQFVMNGGTLVTLSNAADLPLIKFELPVNDVVDGMSSKEFFCPGSLLKMEFDTSNPIAYGMPEKGLGLFWFSPVFTVQPNRRNDQYRVVARYPDTDPLESGWLIGLEKLVGKASIIDADMGEGKVILIGFRPQLRAQTHGTFKILFNALYYGTAEEVELGNENEPESF